ncbi:MAG: terminase family protein [Candidatus Bathyarchaeia archaeon]
MGEEEDTGLNPPDDILEFCSLIGFKPKSFQEKLLKDESKRISVLFARQSGKSTCLAIKAIHYALTHPKTTTLIICPVYRQTLNLGDKISEILNSLPEEYRKAWCLKVQKLRFYFRNLSRILLLSALSMDKIRGYTSHMILIDEMAFIKDDEKLVLNVLYPMLSTTDGAMICSSTPWGVNSMFYRVCHDPSWSHHIATWEDAYREGLYSKTFVETELKALRESNPQQFKIEYECEFIPDMDSWLSQDLIAKCVDGSLEYVDYGTQLEGEFYAGVDLGKHQDYSVIAVLKREDDVLKLIHLKRFPLETAYASVIGYLKGLYDNLKTIQSILMDQTGVGEYIVEDVRNTGLPVEGVILTAESKEQIMTYLKNIMMRGLLKYPYDRQLLHEMNVEKYELSKSGHVMFTHPSGTHDDMLWALALAVYASKSAQVSAVKTRKILSWLRV